MSELAKEMQRIGSMAVKEAQRKSLENGVANVYRKMVRFTINYQMELSLKRCQKIIKS
jgi:hypothetical protein